MKAKSIIALAVVVVFCMTMAAVMTDDSSADTEKVSYTVTNNTGVETTFKMIIDDKTVVEKTMASKEKQVFSIDTGVYTLQVYSGDKLLDQRAGSIQTDTTVAYGTANFNITGIKAEAGTYTVSVLHFNPDFTISTAVTGMDGNPVNENNLTNGALVYGNDTISVDTTPTKASGQAEYAFYQTISTNGSGNLFLYTYPAVERVIRTYTDATLEVGIKLAHFLDFKIITPDSSKDNGDGTTDYTYTLCSGSAQAYAIRADVPTDEKYITFAAELKFASTESKNPQVVDLTADGYMLVDGKTSKTTVAEPTALNEISDVYANVDYSGTMSLKTGDSERINMFREFQALDSTTNNYFIEPVYTYTVLEGKDVVSVDSDGTVTALKAGTAYVTVTYKAMNYLVMDYSSALATPTFYPAVLPANTYTFVVRVSDTGEFSEVQTNITVNDGLNTLSSKNTVDGVDCDIDTFYYLKGEKGYTYTFTPASGSSVKVYNPVFTDGVLTSYVAGTVTVEEGTFTILLTEGRNIVQVTNGDAVSYQVMRALPVTVEVKNTTSEARDQDGTVIPGDVLTITVLGVSGFDKLAGVYNPQSDVVMFTDSEGNTFTSTSPVQYRISFTTLTATVTVPEVTGEYSLTACVKSTGYGDPVGNHHFISEENGRGSNMNAKLVTAYDSAISKLTFKVADYYTIDYDVGTTVDLVKTCAKGSYEYGALNGTGANYYFVMNPQYNSYTVQSSSFLKDGEATTDIAINKTAITVNGTTYAAGKVIVAKDLTAGTYKFSVSIGPWPAMISTYSATITVADGTYHFYEYVAPGSSTTIQSCPVSFDSKNIQLFNTWTIDGKAVEVGSTLTPTADTTVTATWTKAILFDANGGKYVEDGKEMTVDTIADAAKLSYGAVIITTADITESNTVTLGKELMVNSGTLTFTGKLTVSKNHTLTVAENATAKVTGTLVNSGTIANNGTFQLAKCDNVTITGNDPVVLPYFVEGDTSTFTSGYGTVEHTAGQDKCIYTGDKSTITVTVTSLPKGCNNGWDDFGTVTITGISIGETTPLVYVPSHFIGKVTVNGTVYYSYFKVTAIDSTVVDKLNETGADVVLPQALRATVFGEKVKIVTGSQYTDTHGSVVHYDITETTPAYYNGFITYAVYAYETTNPDWRYAEQIKVTKVDYAEGMTTYDTKLSSWSKNDLVSSDSMISGSWPDMIGAVVMYTLTFKADGFTFNYDSITVPSNSVIHIDGNTLTVAGYTVIATERSTREVTLTPGDGYTYSVESPQEVKKGGSLTFSVNIAEGYQKTADFAVMCNGTVLEEKDGKYTISDIWADCTVTVTGLKELPKYTVTLTEGEGYTYSVESPQMVHQGCSLTFSVLIDEAYEKTADFAVKCDGTALEEKDGKYTISNVQKDCTVTVTGLQKKGSQEYSFYLCDNFTNDKFTSTASYPLTSNTAIPGIWVKGTGADAKIAFVNAISKMKYSCTFADDGSLATVSYTLSGKTTTIQTDEKSSYAANLYVLQYVDGKWVDKTADGVFLKLSDVTSTYVAVVHGASTLEDHKGDAPIPCTFDSTGATVAVDPTNIKWYWGDTASHSSGKAVTFYIGDVLTWGEFEINRNDNSNPNTLLIPGLWIQGNAPTGSSMKEALKDALNCIEYRYLESEIDNAFIGNLNRICSDNNFVQAGWNTTTNSWDQNMWLNNVTVDDCDYFAIIHGEWEGGAVTPPYPDATPSDIIWKY